MGLFKKPVIAHSDMKISELVDFRFSNLVNLAKLLSYFDQRISREKRQQAIFLQSLPREDLAAVAALTTGRREVLGAISEESRPESIATESSDNWGVFESELGGNWNGFGIESAPSF
jgi:hypothetical protein